MTRCAVLFAIILAQAITAFSAIKEPDRNCVVCSNLIHLGQTSFVLPAKSETILEHIKTGAIANSQLYTNSDPKNPNGLAVGLYVRVCETCNKIDVGCYICRLPVLKKKSVRTTDGR